MMAEPFGGAAGTGFLWEEWLDRWMDERLDQRMDGWTGHREKKRAHIVNA